MTDQEWKYWTSVTGNSQFRWTEDQITRLNGRGALYYFGGESGVYMRIQPEGTLCVGTYEGAFPHIGEASFTIKATEKYDSFDRAFQKAAELGGAGFLRDMFSAEAGIKALDSPAEGPKMQM